MFKKDTDPIKDLNIGIKYNIQDISDLDKLNIDDLKYVLDAISSKDKKGLNNVAFGGRLLSEYESGVLMVIYDMFERRYKLQTCYRR